MKGLALTPALGLVAGASADPLVPPWVVAGDVTSDFAVVKVGGLGGGLLRVEWSAPGHRARRVTGSRASSQNGFTAQAELSGLPPNALVQYRGDVSGRQVGGQFRTAPVNPDKSVRFVWGGDVVGQGWGIDPHHGGMLTFHSMLRERPHFLLHCGDSIYADDVLPAQKVLRNGEVWKNLLTPAKRKAAKSLDDFHGAYSYNFLDKHYRRFFSQVPVIAQWDDHEVFNNWNPREHSEMGRLGFEAFNNYWPIRTLQPSRLYRKVSYGPNVDVFVLDLRSHRAPNSHNRQKQQGPDTVMLGPDQMEWFKRELVNSKATWKIVAGEMPLATVTPEFGLDTWCNGDGPPLGREHELADILSHIKKKGVKNVAWFSADVHYAMAIHYSPERAKFREFLPFWEFIAGPLHAGTFSPQGDLDPTFGPGEKFCAVSRSLKPNRPPSEDLQFYGRVEARADRLRVTLHNRKGRKLYGVEIPKE